MALASKISDVLKLRDGMEGTSCDDMFGTFRLAAELGAAGTYRVWCWPRVLRVGKTALFCSLMDFSNLANLSMVKYPDEGTNALGLLLGVGERNVRGSPLCLMHCSKNELAPS